jgi:hypothetical protein
MLFRLFAGLFLLFLNIWEELSANERLQHFRYSQAILGLIIFKDATHSPFCGSECTIQHVYILLLALNYINTYTSAALSPHLILRFLDW